MLLICRDFIDTIFKIVLINSFNFELTEIYFIYFNDAKNNIF